MLRRPKLSMNEAVAPKEAEEGAFCSMESDVRIA
jgi:hypothetical protein